MEHIMLTDLVPIFVIMILGYIAGFRKDFTADGAQSLNRFVLNYALPAALFVSIVKSDRAMLFSDVRLLLVSLGVIIGCYFLVYWGCLKLFKHTKAEAAVAGLVGGAPTIGYLGFAVLEPIYGTGAVVGLVVAVVAIVVNAITIPIALFLLNPTQHKTLTAPVKLTTETASVVTTNTDTVNQSAHGSPVSATTQRHVVSPEGNNSVLPALINALKEPVCWAPLLAVAIVLTGWHFPSDYDPIFKLIAKANAGVAVFAAGITLSVNRFELGREIFFNAFMKLMLMPALMLVIGLAVGMSADKIQMLVLCGALPPVFSGIIIGSRFQTYVRTGTSSLAVSTFLFMATAPFWIWFTRLITG